MSDAVPPNSPKDISDITILKDDDAFALLRPVNPNAQNAFDAAVDAIITRSDEDGAFQHFRRYIHSMRDTARSWSVFTEDRDNIAEEPGVDQTPQRWTGAFKFSLRTPPRDRNLGWYLGTSRGPSASLRREVDILLAPPTGVWAQSSLAGSHARLHFHPETYRMVLQARHTVLVGKSQRIIRDSQSQVLDDKDFVMIGECTYAFEYTTHFRTPEFEAELSQCLQQTYGSQWAINKLLTPASVGVPIPLGEYYRSPNAFAQGTFGQVAVGWTKGGLPVAIKNHKSPRVRDLEMHKELMQTIGNHDNVLQLLDCITNFQTQVPTAYCIYSPLAVMNLRDMIESYETNRAAHTTLLTDYLAGLSHLHGKGIMHRDIKPENLAIRSISNPVGIILDLDAATSSQTSIDHGQGTIRYLAPEIIALKECNSMYDLASLPPYEKTVDIWALGLSIYAMLTGRHWSWRLFSHGDQDRLDRCSPERYGRFRQRLQQMIQNQRTAGFGDVEGAELTTLVFSMTHKSPEDRLSASELLDLAQAGAAATSNADIKITPKQAVKHRIDDQGAPRRVKWQNIE